MLEKENLRGGYQLSGFSAEALDRLAAYRWPGDTRQFEALVDQACQRADGPEVQVDDLPELLHQAARAEARPAPRAKVQKLDVALAEAERELIARALASAKGNRSQAARNLGISRPRLLRRISQLDLEDDG